MRSTTAAILTDPEFPRLKEWLIEHTGFGYYADRDEDLADRIGRRMLTTGLPNCAAYASLLREGAAGRRETEMLIADLTVGETYFFRQRPHFDVLRDTILPELRERNRSARRLRIWSAGCATGAEPYTLAILIRDEMAGMFEGWDISVLGTDVNRDFLARANAGRFDKWAFREMDDAVRQRCFVPEGNSWVLRPEFRRDVHFEYHNLVTDPAPPAVNAEGHDLILCRNVMIYFTRAAVAATVRKLYDALVPGGWLLVGHAEPNAEVFKAFRTIIERGNTFYQKPPFRHAAAPPASEPSWTGAEPAAVLRPAPARRMRPAGTPHKTAARKPAAARRPTPQPAGIEEIRALADAGQWEAAKARCRELLAVGGLNPAAHFTFGLILEHAGEHREAEQSLRRAVYLDPAFAMAHYHLGVCLQRNGRPPEARKAFRNVLELLSGEPDDNTVPDGDGISAAELRELAKMYLELIERP